MNFMPSRPGFFILVFSLCIGSFCRAERLPGEVVHFPEFPEISQSYVFDLVQDAQGYIWIGTYNGLYRFDGYQLREYKVKGLDEAQESLGPVRKIIIDRDQNIWLISLWKGLYILERGSGELIHIPLSLPHIKHIQNSDLNHLALDGTGHIWIGITNNYLARIHAGKRKQDLYIHGNWNILSELYTDKKGYICISADQDIWNIDSFNNKPKIKEHIQRDLSYQKDPRHITSIHLTTYGSIEMLDNQGYALFKSKQKLPGSLLDIFNNESLGEYRKLKCVVNHILWIHVPGKGLCYTDLNSGKIAWYKNNRQLNCISSDYINALMTDRSGNLWVATSNGLNKINVQQQHFEIYNIAVGQNGIRSVLKDGEGNTWLGTEGQGLVRLNISKESRTYKPDKAEASYGYNWVNAICDDGKNHIYFGGPQGMYCLDKKTEAIRTVFNPEPPMQFMVFAVGKGPGNDLLVGLKEKGLLHISEQGAILKRLPLLSDDGERAASVWCIYQSGSFTWIGSSIGLFQYDAIKDTCIYIKKQHSPESGTHIFCIYQTDPEHVWMGTADNGLHCYNISTGNFSHYRAEVGIPSDCINGLTFDGNGLLWLATSNGLCAFDLVKKQTLRTYTTHDGLPGNYIKCCYRHVSGEIILGGKNGYTFFFPQPVVTDTFNPPVVVSALHVLYHERTSELTNNGHLELEHEYHSFSIDFAALDYTNPFRNIYAYQLEGLDTGWIYCGSRHTIAYSNLAPGTYRLLIKGTNSSGLWSKHIFSAAIVIKPAFWQTWWFKLLALLILGAIPLLIFLILFIRNIQKRKLVQSELQVLRSQLHPHFVFNSLSSLQHFVIDRKDELALDYIENFSQLMRLVLENSKKETVSLQEEIRFMELYIYMESVRLSGKVQFIIETDPALEVVEIRIPPMLLQPLVENAIKHGQLSRVNEGKVTIRFKAGTSFYICEVEDNGVGRALAATNTGLMHLQKKSMGLEITERRLRLFRKHIQKDNLIIEDLYDGEGNSAGTRVSFKLPI